MLRPLRERDEEEWGMAGENNELVSFAPKLSKMTRRKRRALHHAGGRGDTTGAAAVALISS